jgi:hypothetical protein
MATQVLTNQDFNSVSRILNLLDGVGAQEPATVAQLRAAVEGLAWKDDVVVASPGINITISSPGATINAISMGVNDRVLLKDQALPAENGIYIWNGAAIPMTRSLDMNESSEFNQAVVTANQGTSAGVTFRQTAVNPTVGTTAISFGTFGTSAPAASESTQGIMEIASQAETDAGTDDQRALTPLKFSTSPLRLKKYSANIGDGAATSYVVTHNLNTRDAIVEVYRNTGNYDRVLVDIQMTSVNTATIVFATAPASNAFRVVVIA